MTNKLEKVLELLINENEKQASAMLHEWFVEKAREIHNQLVEEDDAVLEDDDEEVAAERFYEAGEDDEATDDMDMGDAEMELDADLEDGEGDDMGDDMDYSDDSSVDLKAQVDDLESELEALKAEFEQLMADEDGEDHGMGDDMDDDMAGEEEAGEEEEEAGEEEVEENIYDTEGEGSHDAKDFVKPGHGDADGVYEDGHKNKGAGSYKSKDFVKPGYGDADGVYEGDDCDDDDEDEFKLDEDEFADLEESAMGLLSAVNAKNTEAEIGTGASKKLAVNSDSPVPSHKVEDRIKGEPVQRKSSEHNGFGMETQPNTKMGNGSKAPCNTLKKSKDSLSKVARDGNSSAKLNSVEGGEGNMHSPVPTNKGKKN